MASIGKLRRINRFKYSGSRFGLIVPIDHGLTLGPVDGIESVAAAERWIGDPSVTGIIAHKGIAERLIARNLLPAHVGLMIHVNGMSSISSAPDTKAMLTSVEAALRLGADGISLQINFDGINDVHNLTLLGRVVDEAQA